MCKSTSQSFSKGEAKDSQERQQEDMRWQLTEEEKEGAGQLKEAADAEGLYYKNLFELAKYVLVVRSLEKDPELRLEAALRRLRKRHAWMEKHKLHQVDEVAAHEEIGDHACPEHFIQRFQREQDHDRPVVALHMAHSPLSYIQQSPEHKAKYLAAAMYRMDLGAVDMAEARRGMALVTVSQGQLTFQRAWKYMRFMKKLSPDLKDMHPHTVKAVHAEFPSLVAHLFPAVKHVLPRKVADRVHVYSSINDMSKHLETLEDEEDDLSAGVWARRRHECYQETVAKLTLE